MKVDMGRLCLSFIILCGTIGINGQQLNFKSYGGLAYYLGDLSANTSFYSISDPEGAFGLSFGGAVSNIVNMNARFSMMSISGSDANAQYIPRRRRNLSFRSNIFELGIHSEIKINHIWNRLDSSGIQVHLTAGVNIFHFNPKADFMGETYALQSLSTEGQGSFNYPDRRKYELTQINIPIGAGIDFSIIPELRMGIEFAPRLTFTDYLDDVSTSYINYNDQFREFGEISALLANRTGEFLGIDPVHVKTGTQRGNPDKNDWYMFMGFYLLYTIGSK